MTYLTGWSDCDVGGIFSVVRGNLIPKRYSIGVHGRCWAIEGKIAGVGTVLALACPLEFSDEDLSTLADTSNRKERALARTFLSRASFFRTFSVREMFSTITVHSAIDIADFYKWCLDYFAWERSGWFRGLISESNTVMDGIEMLAPNPWLIPKLSQSWPAVVPTHAFIADKKSAASLMDFSPVYGRGLAYLSSVGAVDSEHLMPVRLYPDVLAANKAFRNYQRDDGEK